MQAKLFGVDRLAVDWADTPETGDDAWKQTVWLYCLCNGRRKPLLQCKTVYVRNIRDTVTEENIKEVFEKFGAIEKVQKIKDFAFVHYEQRDDAVKVRL